MSSAETKEYNEILQSLSAEDSETAEIIELNSVPSPSKEELEELIKWAKDNDANLLVVNIADFVISELWRNIEKQKNGDGILYFDNTMDI